MKLWRAGHLICRSLWGTDKSHPWPDSTLLPEGQDSIIIGATALMLHDRLATLEKFIKLKFRFSSKNLDQNLFLADTPPPDLEYKHAGFIWWTSIDPGYRR